MPMLPLSRQEDKSTQWNKNMYQFEAYGSARETVQCDFISQFGLRPATQHSMT